MAKIFLALIAPVLLSCQKEISLSNDSDQLQEMQKASITQESNATKGVLIFDEWLVNTCYPENVHLSGNAPYSIREFYGTDKRYYIDYRIDFNNVSGVGQTSGLTYKGTGFTDGRVNASLDTSSQRVEGKYTYKLRLIAGSNKMLIREDAHFIQNSNGIVEIDVRSSSYPCIGF
jgi:hypothetical protein